MRLIRTALSCCTALLVLGAVTAAPAAAQSDATQFQTALNGMGFHNAGTSTSPSYQYTAFVGNTSTAIAAAESFATSMRGSMSYGTSAKVVTITSPVTASPQSQTQTNRGARAIIGYRFSDGTAHPVSWATSSTESAILLVASSPQPYSSAAGTGVKPGAGGDGGTATVQLQAGQVGAALGGGGADAQAAASTAPAGQGQSGAKGGLGGAAIAQSVSGSSSGARMAVAVGGEGGDGSDATAAGVSSGNETTGLNGGAGGDGGTASAVPGSGNIGVSYTRSGGDGGDGGYGSSLGGSGAKGGTAGLSSATAQTALAYHFATSAAGGGKGGNGGHSSTSGTGGGGGKGGAGGTAQATGDGSLSAAIFAQGGTGGVGGTGGDGGTPGVGGAAGSAGSSSTSSSSLAAAIPGYAGTAGSGGAMLAGLQQYTDPVQAALAEQQAQRIAWARQAARTGDR